MKQETKIQKIKQALLSGAAITSLSAFKIARTTRLSAIIFNLRELGIPIVTGSPDSAHSEGLINEATRRAMMLEYDNSHFAVYYIKPSDLLYCKERWDAA